MNDEITNIQEEILSSKKNQEKYKKIIKILMEYNPNKKTNNACQEALDSPLDKKIKVSQKINGIINNQIKEHTKLPTATLLKIKNELDEKIEDAWIDEEMKSLMNVSLESFNIAEYISVYYNKYYNTELKIAKLQNMINQLSNEQKEVKKENDLKQNIQEQKQPTINIQPINSNNINQLIQEATNNINKGITPRSELEKLGQKLDLTNEEQIIIGNAIKMQEMNKRNLYDINAMANFAIFCYDSTLMSLLNRKGIGLGDNNQKLETIKMMEALKMSAGLKMYNDKYNIFIQQFQRLPEDKKNSMLIQLANNNQYVNKFNLEKALISPETMQRKINEEIEKEVRSWVDNNKQNQGKDFGDDVKKATTLMTPEEVAKLYHEIIMDIDDKKKWQQTQEEKDNYTQIAIQQKNAMQELFVDIIRQKIGGPTLNNPNIPENQKAEVQKMIEKLNIAICKDYLKEDPKFEIVYNNSTENIPENMAVNQANLNNAIAKAQERYFGMGKLEQAMKKASYRKLIQLQNELGTQKMATEEDIKEVEGMFRR